MDRQVLAAPESFKRCLDGLVTIGSPDSATKSQYKADMTQVNAERHSRNEAALVPSQQRTSGRGTIMSMHGNPKKFRNAKLKEKGKGKGVGNGKVGLQKNWQGIPW